MYEYFPRICAHFGLCWFSPLFFSGQLLGGQVPKELGLLTKAAFLSLRNNELTGTIPTELGLVKNMAEFRLSENALVGSVPEELGYVHPRSVL